MLFGVIDIFAFLHASPLNFRIHLNNQIKNYSKIIRLEFLYFFIRVFYSVVY